MGKKRIFARHRVPINKKELENNLDKSSKFFNLTRDQLLDSYTKTEIGIIAYSTEIILREQQRIKKARKCIEILRAIMNKGASNYIRVVTEKYYRDLLGYTINKAKSKIKNRLRNPGGRA